MGIEITDITGSTCEVTAIVAKETLRPRPAGLAPAHGTPKTIEGEDLTVAAVIGALGNDRLMFVSRRQVYMGNTNKLREDDTYVSTHHVVRVADAA